MAALQFVIGGEVVACPAEVEEKGDDAVNAWYAATEAPHAEALFKKSGLKAADVTRTGHGNTMLVSDVERALLAREAAKAKVTPADEAADTPKEG